MSFELPPLPYEKNALEPHITARTFEFHYGKHHQAYVTKLNELLAGKPGTTLEELIKTSTGPVFNNAAQIWNHTFFWKSMAPTSKGGGQMPEEFKKIVSDRFGSPEAFLTEFTNKGTTLFGSGWVWLYFDMKSKKIEIGQGKDAENPIREGNVPLLTLDVWEHAYYIDYQNARPKFIETFLTKLANFGFALENLKKNVG